MSFKEFKNKCKKEKTKTYKTKQLSTILALVGFAVVFVGFYLNNSSAQLNIIPYVIGLPIAIIGAILDVVCDKNMKKEYKAFLNSENWLLICKNLLQNKTKCVIINLYEYKQGVRAGRPALTFI